MLVRRSFRHYFDKEGKGGIWYHCLINQEKLYPLTNKIHKKVRKLINDVIIPKKVPDEYFVEDADRCCTMNGFKCHVLERPSRYKAIIEKALANLEGRQRHYVVEKALIESPETMFVVGELPVWLPEGKRVGHIDLVELAEGNPSLVVHDYKPRVDEEDASGQISMYGIMLAQLLNVPLSEIQVGWFNEVKEKLVVE